MIDVKFAVLLEIFKKPEKWTHIREFSRLLKLSPNTVRKQLDSLVKNQFVEKRIQGNLIQFRANLSNDKYELEKKLYNIRSIYETGLADVLYDHYNAPIVLFGSYARGEDISTSDIDIGIITENKKRLNLDQFEKQLQRKIQLSLFTKKQVSKEFFNNLINGIVLKGMLKNE